MRQVRETRRWSQQDLANRLGEMGSPTDRATLARTEMGGRGVSLDDALMLAAALDVSPLSLILPDEEEACIALAPAMAASSDDVHRWVCGLFPLPLFHMDGDDADDELETLDGQVLDRRQREDRARHYEHFLPLARWRAYRQPGVQHLVQLADTYATAAADDNRVEMTRTLRQLRHELDRQETELQSRADGGGEG